MKYTCPVCGFDSLPDPPADYKICPCCGTEFGLSDLIHSWDELRDRWLAKGARWFSQHTPEPAGWNPSVQLAVAGLLVREVSNTASKSATETHEVKVTI
jgi:hypothetical protein